MKKLMILMSIILNAVSSKAQVITLEYSNDTVVFGNFYCTDIGNNDFKYVLVNEKINGFSLYNLDMTPYHLNIIVPSTDSIKNGFTVIYITKTLFDCDSTNLEYAYELPIGGRKPFRVFSTSGAVLLDVDSARGPYQFGGSTAGTYDIRPIKNTPAGTKLFLDKLNPSGAGILIYSLCGSLPADYPDFSETKTYLRMFPNPTNATINFEINFPNNTEEFQLMITDINGQILKRENVPRSKNMFVIDVSNFISGSYFYSLVSTSKAYQTGKFILNK